MVVKVKRPVFYMLDEGVDNARGSLKHVSGVFFGKRSEAS